MWYGMVILNYFLDEFKEQLLYHDKCYREDNIRYTLLIPNWGNSGWYEIK